MRIALIGPGIMPIPPPGWGAVEILIWDYYNELIKLGNDVTIINTKDIMSIVNTVNDGNFDFVHLHYDVFYIILHHLKCPKIAITSHYPYIDQPDKHNPDGYYRVFGFLIQQTRYYNFVLADKDVNTFLRFRADPSKIRKIKNGINSSLFRFSDTPLFNKSIYLGKITPRKNQAKYQYLPDIDFVGNNADPHFNTSTPNYLGEWTRTKIYEDLTHYTNLVLFSQGEADPLVVKEALIAGLGVVVNRSSAENLDPSLDFITVIDDSQMYDLEYVKMKIEENKEKSRTQRMKIRDYGISNFDISIEVKKYVDIINSIE